jgi:hypothetical protein
MANKGTTCKQCGNKFHACSSCGLIGPEYDYCSKKCWDEAGNPDKDCEDGIPFWSLNVSGKVLKTMPLLRKEKKNDS